MMPMYRLSNSFGNIEVPDEFGYYQGALCQICQQARQRANQACLHCDRQRRKRVWESHGAKRLTFQIFFDGCVAVAANELQK